MKFLTLEKEAFGLDISDMSLKIINLKKKNNSFRLASFNQMDIGPGIIEGGVIQNENALVKVIKALCKNVKGEKVNTKYVVASLPEEKSFLQVIQMPKMKAEELKSAVFFEAENYIPLPMSEVYLDFQTITPVKDHLNHLDVLIVAASKKIVNSYVSCLKKAGLIPLILEVESQAIVRALIKNDANNSPVALIDFGKTSTIFTIFAGHSIQFTCSIPVSSSQLTTVISESLKIDLEKAERIKIKYDLSDMRKSDKLKKILQAMSPVLDDLVLQIKKYLNFYQDHASHEHLFSSRGIEKILLCGGGANLKGLPEFLSEKLEIPVTLGDFWINFNNLKIPDIRQALQHHFKNLNNIGQNPVSFATALGLALREVNAENT